LVISKLAQVRHHLELVRLNRRCLPHSLLRFLTAPEIEQHAGVHPVNARSRGIELQTAPISAFRKFVQYGVVVNVSEQIPCEFGIWCLDGSLSQGANGFFIPATLCLSKAKSKKTFYRIRIQHKR